MKTAIINVLVLTAMTAALCGAVVVGLDREAARQTAATAAMCKNYSVAMNNWARQKNLKPLPCEE